ncbi:Bifunctional epoxide hydrolase 2 [Golovinomyces cichoracearum]|uniref:Bifunctional epoxide hydrolase 2 n=1 Tax=Golovinomyces cichoracearum TaxID=62708 RepID=A0A420HZH9_9PEZI|nr:Bifunctional epoxide hydrolase 2 [Golovinomyces cichoracearum]
MVERITPDDARIQWRNGVLNGKNYEYIFAEPRDSKIVNTIILVHGWPDLAFGWRYQIHFLLSLGFRVIAPNMMGYGATDAPDCLEFYTFKRACDDLATLASQLDLTSFVLAGHDWGGAVVYRFALRYPKLVSKLVVICTPFMISREKYTPLTKLPNFKYMLQLAGTEVENFIVGEVKLKQFFSGIFGGTTPEGEALFSPYHGIFLDRLETIGPPLLLSESELDFYVKSYLRNGIRGTLNWYRTDKLNFDEQESVFSVIDKPLFDMPVLFISCSSDGAVPPSLSKGMDIWFRNLTRKEINTGHWAMVENSEVVNQCMREFLK